MGFHDVRFPTSISNGFDGGPQFSTVVVETDSGHEERVAQWEYPKQVYHCERTMTNASEVNTFRDFLLARGGALHSFRFKDWMDYTSEATGNTVASITPLDQVIGEGDGTTTVFYLWKTYTSGSQSAVRRITLPVSGTVRIYVSGVGEMMSGWSVNLLTGAITFTSAPANGATITAGYQFDVPCRFGLEAEAGAQFTLDTHSVHSMKKIPILEVKDESPYFEGWDPGGGEARAMTADETWAISDPKFKQLTPSANFNAYLPPPGRIGSGGPYFKVSNVSGTYTITVRDDGGTSVAVVGTNSVKEFWLLESGSTKTWVGV